MKITAIYSYPGPASFVETVVHSLQQSKSVIILSPTHGMPKGCLEAIQKVYLEREAGRWKNLPKSDSAPIDNLLNAFSERSSPVSFPHIQELIDLDSFKNTVISIGTINDKQWSNWSPLVIQFAELNKNIDELIRSRFICILQTNSRAMLSLSDVLLKFVHWDGVIDLLDMTVFAHSIFKYKAWGPVKKELAISICTELAQWDVELCEILSNRSFEELLSPYSILEEVGKFRGWNLCDSSTQDELWQAGIIHSFNGSNHYHSSYCVLNGNIKVIEKRLWKAQMKVLFPYLEIQRQKFLEEYGHKLLLPHVTSNGEVIENLYDLELGHIDYQLHTNYDISNQKIRKVIRRLKEIRNSLAHSRAIPSEQFAPEIFDMQTFT